MIVLKLSDEDRNQPLKALQEIVGGTAIEDVFSSLDDVVKGVKNVHNYKHRAYCIIDYDGVEQVVDVFPDDKLPFVVAGMLFDSFFNVEDLGFIANVDKGRQQKSFLLLGSNEEITQTSVLEQEDRLLVIASNGVLRLFTIDEVLDIPNDELATQYNQYFEEDQVI